MVLLGIDVSHYQDPTPSLAGVSFLIAKATEGTTHDLMFGRHIAAARAAGLVVGAYHFARDDVSLADQVDAFLAATVDVSWIAFDVEGRHAWSVDATRQAIARVHAAGRRVGLYMSDAAYVDAGQDWRWVANWSASPRHAWDVWQYRGSPLDLDRFDGTIDELRALAQEDPPMVVVSSSSPVLLDLAIGTQLFDQAAHPLVKVSASGAQTGVLSPFEAEFGATFHARAVYVTTGGQRVLAFVHNDPDLHIRPVPPAPTPDCSAPIAAAITADRAKARITYG